MNEAIRQVTHVQNIRYDKATERLYIIDQTLLPNEEKEIELRTVEEMIEAIKMLRIRGAPAIGICAGYCMYALARDIDAKDNEAFYRKLQIDGELLGAARPTAVNLRWAVGEMLDAAKAHLKDDRAELLEALYRKAVDIHEDDIAKCTAISEYGLSLLKDGDGVFFFNFRADRMREIVSALTSPDFSGFDRGTLPKLAGAASMTSYDAALTIPVAFPDQDILSLLSRPEEFTRLTSTEARSLQVESIINALDLMYFWLYQPCAQQTLTSILRTMTREERVIVARSQGILSRVREVSQLFVDGLLGRNFARALSFYLDSYENYILTLNKRCAGFSNGHRPLLRRRRHISDCL